MLVFWIHAAVAVFAVMNPLGNVPVFLALTANQAPADRQALARRCSLFALLIVVFFTLLGQGILQLFGITLDAFRVAGGILLFMIAFNLLQGRSSQVHHPSPADNSESLTKDDIAVVPLATPILAGPGTIATVMALDGAGGGISWINALLIIAAAGAVVLVTFLLFYNADRVRAHISQTAINLLARMMGLILTTVAVQMVAAGLKGLFPGLG
ncbi:MAG: NAAT family transporter [Peptococcaceae bacterium]|nr:NAAT family transporter [Peptococcaceae bacterium]